MKLFSIILFMCSSFLLARADVTNLVYPFDDGSLFVSPVVKDNYNPPPNGKAVDVAPTIKFLPNGDELMIFSNKINTNQMPAGAETSPVLIMDSNKVIAAREMRECLPAKNFPEGNWGDIQGGMQLSLRFDKTAYKLGESITATLLLRNVTNQPVLHSVLPSGYSDGPVGFEVRNTNAIKIIQNCYVPDVIGGQDSEIAQAVAGQTQIKISERFDKRFDLTNDVYWVQAEIRVGNLLATPALKLDNDHTIRVTWQPPHNIKTLKSAKVKIIIEK